MYPVACTYCKLLGSPPGSIHTQAGNYFSTKIWEFHMKCASCKNRLVIRTDPKNCDYEFVEGIRRREQEYDPEAIGLPVLSAEPTGASDLAGAAATPSSANAPNGGVSADPLAALERGKDQVRRTNAAAARLQELMEASDRLEADSSGVNRLLRNKFRAEKKVLEDLDRESAEKGLRFRLLPPSAEDARMAPMALLEGGTGGLTRARRKGFHKAARTKFTSIMSSSIFDDPGAGRRSSSGSSALVVGSKRGDPTKRSKAVVNAETQKDLAVKRARLGIDSSHFKASQAANASTPAPLMVPFAPTRRKETRRS